MNLDRFKDVIRERVFVLGDGTRRIALRGTNEYRNAPWLYDFRSVAFDPEVLDFIAETFWEKYKDKYPFQVGGVETAAIPFVTAIVLKGREKNIPVNGFFIRKSRKRDGLLKMFEGSFGNEPVILIDDLINSGQSLNRQLIAIAEAGRMVSDIFVILAFRSMEAYSFALDRNITITSMFTLEDFGLPLLKQDDPKVPKPSFNILWRYAAGNAHLNYVAEKSAPVIDDERIYFGTDNSLFVALSQRTGEVEWTFKTGLHPKGIFSSPVLWNDTVFFGAYDGSVYALDTRSGKKKWEYKNADWIGSSPALAPNLGLLFIGLEFGLFRKHGGIVALKISNGERVWEDRTGEFTHGSPLYIQEEGLVVIGSNDGVLYAYDAATGAVRWKYQTGGDIKSFPAYDSKRQLILVGSWDGCLYALNCSSGEHVFTYKTQDAIFSTPLVLNDLVYIASLDKTLYAIRLDSGLPHWKFQTSGRIFSSPIAADGSLWIGSNDGRLYELNPESGTLRSFFQASERIVNTIAYDPAKEVFFVPTVANEIFCLKRKRDDPIPRGDN